MAEVLQTCPTCRVGTLRQRTATYAARHGDEFVVLPGAPAWVCDVCGERTFDEAALEQLLPLIGPPASTPGADDAVGAQRSADLPSSLDATRTRRRA
jgi:YgiT-type zinc finger domain-containing protein